MTIKLRDGREKKIRAIQNGIFFFLEIVSVLSNLSLLNTIKVTFSLKLVKNQELLQCSLEYVKEIIEKSN